MNGKKCTFFRERLIELARDLENQDDLGQAGQKPVTLDQQSVGRLSRMDAMQQQAMARASQGRRDLMKRRIQAALQRIDEDEFGYCVDCGGEIPEKRLEFDPTVPQCISCATG